MNLLVVVDSDHIYQKKKYMKQVHLLPNYWGKGYATEALNKVICHAFETLKVKNLFAGHNPNNIKSKKMLEKLGFNFIGAEYYIPTGLQHPSYLYKKINIVNNIFN